MRSTVGWVVAAAGVGLLGVACGGGDNGTGNRGSMMGPSAVASPSSSAAVFMSVTPQGGATGVSVSSPIVLRFGAPMGSGMEQFIDLHVGDLSGPTVPMSFAWSADRQTLTCTPAGPLAARTTYVIHMGGGLMTQAGQIVDDDVYGPMMGGQWITGGMMGGSHGGSPWGMMGGYWRGSNGSYGMAFPFTTAG